MAGIALPLLAFFIPLMSAQSQAVTSVAAGNDYTLFVRADGTLWAVGANDHGELGDGTTTPRSVPAQVATEVESVAVGRYYSLFVKIDGTLWAMGLNVYGQLGDGTHTDRQFPVRVAEGVASVSAGYAHTLLIKRDGTLWATGLNVDGRLGDGTMIDRSSPVLVASDVASASAGYDYSMFVKRDGTLWGVGNNAYGRLADGNTLARITPGLVASGVASVAADGYHTMFVKTDGTLWGVGANRSGALGDGTTIDRGAPVQIASGVATVAVGEDYTMFVKKDGTLWATGYNTSGQLGDGTLTSRSLPAQVATGVILVYGGYDHTMFVRNDGSLWGMGSNGGFQLGDGTAASYRSTPVEAAVPRNVSIATGADASSVFTEGDNVASRPVAVAPALTLVSNTPTLASATVSLARGFYATQDSLAFTNDGASMGDIVGSYNGRTGVLALTSASGAATLAQWQNALRSVVYANNSEDPYCEDRVVAFVVSDGSSLSAAATRTVKVVSVNDTPAAIMLSGRSVFQSEGADATIGAFTTVDLDSSRFTYSLTPGEGANNNADFHLFGAVLRANNAAKLAAGTYSVRLRSEDGDGGRCEAAFTITVHAGAAPAVTAVAMGGNHTMFVKADGSLWATGDNRNGQLGDGTKASRSTPILVANGVAAVAAGGSHTLFVKTDGTLWAVGANWSGQLGDGTTTDRILPVYVSSGVASVAAGSSHSLFVKTDGTLWAFGSNYYGQLGDGTTTTRSKPAQVFSGVASVAAGADTTFFVKTDGSLWGTGDNWSGQLGDGTTSKRNAFVRIANDVASVSGGPDCTLFVRTNGSLWAMGRNDYGQLGDGTWMSQTAPIQVATDATKVTTGNGHTLFIKSDRTLWAVGRNGTGQRGDGGDYESKNTPVQIARDVVSVAAGFDCTMFIKADGTLWGMGVNLEGKLGNDTTSIEHTPVRLTGAATTIIKSQPSSCSVAVGQSVSLNVTAEGDAPLTYSWKHDGWPLTVFNGASSSLTLAKFKPENVGLYSAVITNAGKKTESDAAIVGITTTDKVVGAGEELKPANILHPNGNVFDQVLLTGREEAITADFALNQVTRTSFIDADDDIVQVEFSGPGTLSLAIDGVLDPAVPVNYNQDTKYVKGHASIVITGATEQTNVSVFSVGRKTAVNQALFKDGVNYDGVADIAFIAIQSANGKFGSVRTANANYFAVRGLTGLYAPGVAFQGPVYLGNVTAFDLATPVIRVGAASDVRITGGDLEQANGTAVQVSGIAQLKFTAGSDSHGNEIAAQKNKAVLRQDGVEVTAQIVVNP